MRERLPLSIFPKSNKKIILGGVFRERWYLSQHRPKEPAVVIPVSGRLFLGCDVRMVQAHSSDLNAAWKKQRKVLGSSEAADTSDEGPAAWVRCPFPSGGNKSHFMLGGPCSGRGWEKQGGHNCLAARARREASRSRQSWLVHFPL